MAKSEPGIIYSNSRRHNAIHHGVCLLVALALLSPAIALSAPELLVESNDYKDKEFIKGCISDYKEMAKGDDIDWIWSSPGVQLADYKLTVAKFESRSDDLRKSQLEEIKAIFKEFLGKLKGGKGTLSADICIYEVQKFSAGKAWIPFAGGHQMQAGIGVELTLKDKKGKAVARIRHFAREGAKVEDAAQEVAEDLKKYIGNH